VSTEEEGVNETIGDRIRGLVEKADSEAAFARAVGITVQALRLYIHGNSIPRSDRLVQIAAVAGVDIAWLATGIESVKKTSASTEGRFAFLALAYEDEEIRGWLNPELADLERRLRRIFPEWDARQPHHA
jgi:transcriptional regulator with XRE-family HTH domain